MSASNMNNPEQMLESNEHGRVFVRAEYGENRIVQIEHQLAQASFSLYGGQVLTWQPIGQAPVFWLSQTSALDGSKAIRGGVPICWPWFGPRENAPQHGFARNSLWQLSAIEISAEQVMIELSLGGERQSPCWDNAFDLKQRLIFAETFTQELQFTNLSQHSCEVTDALHSYFLVSAPQHVAIPELNPCMYDDKITGTENNPPHDVFSCQGPIDRVYYHEGSVTLIDKGMRRAIEIKKSNSEQTVLWNPDHHIASTMTDVHPGGETEFVCVEPANTEAQSVAAGARLSMSQTILVYAI
ncbi:D-hexose-6-phosphate mutarotase [Thalassotalea maritima]|uniref:D-hexose-6-phosphate mutarotase n=1 Tax=Thalassotalea maritima TaxID=3242416 RepID=UPI003528DA17